MLKDIEVKTTGLARAGKIRLGYLMRKCPHCNRVIKAKLGKCPDCHKKIEPPERRETFPTSTNHFVLDELPELIKIYGDKPTRLNIWFPFDSIEENLPAAYTLYSANSLLCKGDGENILYAINPAIGRRVIQDGIFLENYQEKDVNGKTMHFSAGNAAPCPGRNRDLYSKCRNCRAQMTIKVMIREINRFVTFDIISGSINNYIRLREQLNFFAAPKEQGGLGVRLRGIPFVLSLKMESVSVPNLGKNGQPKKDEPPRIRIDKPLMSLEVDEDFMRELNQVQRRLASPANLLDWSEPVIEGEDTFILPESSNDFEEKPLIIEAQTDPPKLSDLTKLEFFNRIKMELGVIPQVAGWLIKRAGLVNGEYNPDNAEAMWTLIEQAKPLLDFLDEAMAKILYFDDPVQVLERIEAEMIGAGYENGILDFKAEISDVLLGKLSKYASSKADEQIAE